MTNLIHCTRCGQSGYVVPPAVHRCDPVRVPADYSNDHCYARRGFNGTYCTMPHGHDGPHVWWDVDRDVYVKL